MTKLDWNYDERLGCEVAYLRGYRIKAEHDVSPSNPFEEEDGHWPIHVYAGRDGSWEYPKHNNIVRDVLYAIPDPLMVHSQKEIAAALREYLGDLRDHCADLEDDAPTPKWMTDACVLRSWFEEAWDCFEGSKQLEVAAELYGIAGIPAYVGTSRGYSQGDWAEVLVVATPEAQAKFGCTDVTSDDLEATVDLYGYWAWGDVYGYVIEKPIFDDDGDIEDWEEIDSCWGYYGDDHDESGLEDQAVSCVPDEVIRSPEAIEESV